MEVDGLIGRLVGGLVGWLRVVGWSEVEGGGNGATRRGAKRCDAKRCGDNEQVHSIKTQTHRKSWNCY